MGISITDILYDLSELIQVVDLPALDDPFSLDEIQAVLRDIPSNHAPGPDGFNGAFYKKCLSIIKDDIIKLCADFA